MHAMKAYRGIRGVTSSLTLAQDGGIWSPSRFTHWYTSNKRLHGLQNWSAEQIVCSGNACNFDFGSFHLRSLIKLRKLLFTVVLLSPHMLNGTGIVP